MKIMIPLVVVAVLLAAGASPQRSGWMESFDTFKDYPYNSWPSDGTKTLPAPWEGAVSMYAQADIGRDDTAGAGGPGGGWSWGHAFRSTTDTPRVGDSLVARIFLPGGINYESVMLAFATDKTPGASGQFGGAAKAVLHVGGSADKGFARVSLRTTDPSDKQVGAVSAAPHPFLPSGAWYDVRVILGKDRTVILEYKHMKMSTWIGVGALSVHDDFRPDYVAISTSRGGRMDDVGYRTTRKGGSPFSP